MIHSVRFTAVLDTNIMYPVRIRDILFWFAYYGIFTPKWSDDIFDELKDVMERKGGTKEQILKRIKQIDDAFPDAKVGNYQPLIDNLTLKDKKDRHVLAAAIKTNANVIVTNNLKDFPKVYLKTFGIAPISADDFITNLIDLNPKLAVSAFKEMVLNYTNPDLDEFESLDILRKNGLEQAADYLHSQI
jgi:predicted nucleic acid-binding protein